MPSHGYSSTFVVPLRNILDLDIDLIALPQCKNIFLVHS